MEEPASTPSESSEGQSAQEGAASAADRRQPLVTFRYNMHISFIHYY